MRVRELGRLRDKAAKGSETHIEATSLPEDREDTQLQLLTLWTASVLAAKVSAERADK